MSNTIVSSEWPNLPQYRVTLLSDRWDGDSERFTVTLHAFGPTDARLQVKEDHPEASVLMVEKVPSAGEREGTPQDLPNATIRQTDTTP